MSQHRYHTHTHGGNGCQSQASDVSSVTRRDQPRLDRSVAGGDGCRQAKGGAGGQDGCQWKVGGMANSAILLLHRAAVTQPSVCVCVCLLNGGIKFVPLIRAAGCVTAECFQRPAADSSARLRPRSSLLLAAVTWADLTCQLVGLGQLVRSVEDLGDLGWDP